MNPYVLKRRDDSIAVLNLSDEGLILNYKMIPGTEELAPIHDLNSTDWLKKWWSRRAVPISQGHIRQMLEARGLLGSEDYLVKNLGLSLTDYYWISPVDFKLSWKDVNLFENDFHDDINIANTGQNDGAVPTYTPNSSLQGTLDKCWTIRDGKRGMIKGNSGPQSSESFNEVIATRIHEMQDFANHTKYELMEIHNRQYKYGCFSELFTSGTMESIPAYDIVISKKQRPDESSYEHFISVCAERGLDENILRPFLEYQIMTDFIVSNRDRHLSNIAVLRDAETMQFVRPAPIYDSGKSLFVDKYVPGTDKEMLKISTDSFRGTELGLLELVTDRNLVDINKLPDGDFIRNLYSMDPDANERRIDDIVNGYERKIDLFDQWQHGGSPLPYRSKDRTDIILGG